MDYIRNYVVWIQRTIVVDSVNLRLGISKFSELANLASKFLIANFTVCLQCIVDSVVIR